MAHFFTINYPALAAFCNELYLINPGRTKSHLDLMRENIEKAKLADLYNKIIPVEIDYNSKSISLLGEPFPFDFYCFEIFDLPNTHFNRLVHQFNEAKKIARFFSVYEKIFKDINVIK